MMRLPPILIFLLASILTPWPGNTTTKPKASPMVRQAQWVSNMRTALPIILCAEGEYFRQCFNSKISECKAEMMKNTNNCIQQLRLPATFNASTEGNRFAQQLGTCIGLRTEKSWQARKSKNKRCSAPTPKPE